MNFSLDGYQDIHVYILGVGLSFGVHFDLHVHTHTHTHTHTTCTHSKQRLATKQEARELDEEIESRLIDAHSRLEIQVGSGTPYPCHILEIVGDRNGMGF